MNRIVTPWELSDSPFLVLYGSDFALSLSLSRLDPSDFYEEEELLCNTNILYSPSIFTEVRIRSIVSVKGYNQLVKLYKARSFINSCTLIIDVNTISTDIEGPTFVKCEPLTTQTRRLFVDFYLRKLGLQNNLHDTSKIRNLDDLLLMVDGYSQYIDSYDGTVWGLIRLAQMRNTSPIKNIYHHLELWARDNIPNEECLEIIYNQVRREMENFKNAKNK